MARWKPPQPDYGQQSLNFDAASAYPRSEPLVNRTLYRRVGPNGPLPLDARPVSGEGPTPAARNDGSLAERFESFHCDHPHVYLAIESIARQWHAAGKRRVSMKHIFEHIRENYGRSTRGGRWKLDNCFTPFYARLVMERNKNLAGLFETRKRSGRHEEQSP